MTHELKNLKNEAQKIRLSERERAFMRAQIFGAPAAPLRKVPSPYVFFSFSFQRAVAFAVVLLLVVGSTSAYAAEGTVPGDLLYSVKVNVNEPVRGALALSNEAKVSFHTSVAEERLMEAETLAAKGKLSKEATAQIEASFDAHLESASAIAAELENEDAGLAAEASATLDSSIAAHGNILASLGDESKDEETKKNSRSLAERSWSGRGKGDEQAIASTMTMALKVEDNLEVGGAGDASVPPEVQNATTSKAEQRVASQLRERAEIRLAAVRETSASVEGSLAATTSTDIKTQIADLKSRFENAEEAFEAGAYASAKEEFTAVLQASIELSAYIEASKKFKKDFVRFNWRGGGWGGRGWDDDGGDTWDDNGGSRDRDERDEDDKGNDNEDDQDDEDSHDENHDHNDDHGEDNLNLPVKLDL